MQEDYFTLLHSLRSSASADRDTSVSLSLVVGPTSSRVQTLYYRQPLKQKHSTKGSVFVLIGAGNGLQTTFLLSY